MKKSHWRISGPLGTIPNPLGLIGIGGNGVMTMKSLSCSKPRLDCPFPPRTLTSFSPTRLNENSNSGQSPALTCPVGRWLPMACAPPLLYYLGIWGGTKDGVTKVASKIRNFFWSGTAQRTRARTAWEHPLSSKGGRWSELY